MSNADETKPTTKQAHPNEAPHHEATPEAERAANIARIAAALMRSHDETFKELAK